MNKILLIIAVLVVVSFGAYFIFRPKESVAPTSNISQPNTVTIKDFSFSPEILTITAGTQVTWKNEDSATHSIKSETFNSTILNQGDTFVFTFSEKGEFNYSCGLHPDMKGKIVVQ